MLFVSEKLTALEVVKSRLEDYCLGAACLEIHSDKANTNAILKSISNTIQEGATQKVEDIDGRLVKLEKIRTELNTYQVALQTTVGKSNLKPYDILWELSKLKFENGLKLKNLNGIDTNWTNSDINECDDIFKRISKYLTDNEHPLKSCFWGAQISDITQKQISDLIRLLQEVIKLEQNIRVLVQDINKTLGAKAFHSLNDIRCIALSAKKLQIKPSLSEMTKNLKDLTVNQQRSDLIRQLFGQIEAFNRLSGKYAQQILPDAHLQSFYQEKAIYQLKSKSLFRFFNSDFKKAKKKLEASLKIKPTSPDEYLELFDVLINKYEISQTKDQFKLAVNSFLGRDIHFSFENSDILTQNKAAFDYIIEAKKEYTEGVLTENFWEIIHNDVHQISNKSNELYDKVDLLHNKIAEICTILSYTSTAKKALLANNDWLSVINKMLDNIDDLTILCQWNTLKEKLKKYNLSAFYEAVEDDADISSALLYNHWRFSLCSAFLDVAESQNPILKQQDFRQKLEEFKKLDSYHIESFNRQNIKCLHLSNVPSKETAGEQMRILNKEINKSRRHLPIRKILNDAGEMIQRIKPVFMMSPLSVAQYLAPDKLKFDFIIFDEASQVTVEDALGVLLRGGHIVVVGDQQQLPPTNFFSKISDDNNDETDDEEETNDADDSESILELFVRKRAKETMLSWHYRSKHESLITVSNREFYDENLMFLPSPITDKTKMGMQLRLLKHTFYTPTKNELEADAIVEALKEHFHEHQNRRSIGIVTFSDKQKECVKDSIARKRKTDSVFDLHLSDAENKVKEPFFVKNLEYVQGDERDVIFVSICYGYTKEGKLRRNFGPINKTGGEKRLNVLFTRARYQCVLFSNFSAQNLDVSESDTKGLKVFKAFLDFAETGKTTILSNDAETESPFESAVKRALEQKGYTVKTQIGTAGYRIDLAIPDSKNKGRFLVGIECDGAAYHSSKSARDRDRLRQTVLEGLGWKIYRIWSTDWFKNPSKELERLIGYIKKCQDGLETTEQKEAISEPPVVIVDNQHKRDWVIDYKQSNVLFKPDFESSDEFHRGRNSELVGKIYDMLKIESPIHKEYILEYFKQDTGFKITQKVQRKFDDVFEMGRKNGHWSIKNDDFLWLNAQKIEKVRDRKDVPIAQNLDWIPTEEIALTFEMLIKEAIEISEEDLFRKVTETLIGVGKKVAGKNKERLQEVWNTLLNSGLYQQKEGIIRKL